MVASHAIREIVTAPFILTGGEMLETEHTETWTLVLVHPVVKQGLEIRLHSKEAYDLWVPILEKFQKVLDQEAK